MSFNWLRRLWRSGALYGLAILGLWLVFLGRDQIGIYDWPKELAYLDFIKQAFTEWQRLPYYWWQVPMGDALIKPAIAAYPAIAHSRVFIANPETMLFSPFIGLLFFIKPALFIKIVALSHFLIGWWGGRALRVRLRWNDRQYRFWLIFFFASPLVIQHLAIGYTPWLNLYLFPWLVVCLLADRRITRLLGTSAILALVLLQGGSHVFVWFGLLVGLFLVGRTVVERSARALVDLGGIMGATILLAFIKFYGLATVYAGFVQDVKPGYSLGSWLFWSLSWPRQLVTKPVENPYVYQVISGVPSWDGGLFLGAGLLLIVGLWFGYRRFNQINRIWCWLGVILLVLSFGGLWAGLTSLVGWPLLASAEKYSFRLFIPALLAFSLPIGQLAERLRWRRRWAVSFELAIFIPLFWASFVWLGVLTSNPLPHLAAGDGFGVTTKGRMIVQGPLGEAARGELKAADRPYLIKFNLTGGTKYLIKSTYFDWAMLVTAISWGSWLIVVLSYRAGRRWARLPRGFTAELHCHSDYSKDGAVSLDQIIELAERQGLSIIALTDHDTIEGALRLKKMAPAWLTVIVGEEISTKEGDLIGLYLESEVKPGQTMRATIKQVKAQGGLALLPHPFDRIRRAAAGPAVTDQIKKSIDAIEVYNSRCLWPGDNRRAAAFARAHDLVAFVGSDAHTVEEYGRSRVFFASRPKTAVEFRLFLKKAALQPARSSPLVHLKTFWQKRRNRRAQQN